MQICNGIKGTQEPAPTRTVSRSTCVMAMTTTNLEQQDLASYPSARPEAVLIQKPIRLVILSIALHVQ